MEFCVNQNQAVFPLVLSPPNAWILIEFNQPVYGIVILSKEQPSYQGNYINPPTNYDMIYAIENETSILINQYVNDYIYIYITYPLFFTQVNVNNGIEYVSNLGFDITTGNGNGANLIINYSTWSIVNIGGLYFWQSDTYVYPTISTKLCTSIEIETAFSNGTVPVNSTSSAFQPNLPQFVNPITVLPKIPSFTPPKSTKVNDLTTLGIVGALGIVGYVISKAKK